MVVLQRRLIIVHQGDGISCLDQEVIVEPSMIKVVNYSSPVASQMQSAGEGIGLQQASVTQQHVRHLQHRRHMRAAAYNQERYQDTVPQLESASNNNDYTNQVAD